MAFIITNAMDLQNCYHSVDIQCFAGSLRCCTWQWASAPPRSVAQLRKAPHRHQRSQSLMTSKRMAPPDADNRCASRLHLPFLCTLHLTPPHVTSCPFVSQDKNTDTFCLDCGAGLYDPNTAFQPNFDPGPIGSMQMLSTQISAVTPFPPLPPSLPRHWRALQCIPNATPSTQFWHLLVTCEFSFCCRCHWRREGPA